ncbi:MAG: Wzz/FepE/Etk N-terminal domain-containing protein [Sulfurospirillaceae bacterium]|nr:Wzz/FepE/Etk N-terminal domain-containing protein [Sulfurospirillaceae bacterium]
MNQIKENHIQEDEIDLRELFKTIMRHKKFILLFTTIVTFMAVIYVFVKTPLYEVKSNIQLGYIGDNILGDPDAINKELRVVFHVDERQDEKNTTSLVTNASVNSHVKNFIEVTTEGISNKEALAKNQEVLKYAQSMFTKKINNYITNIKNQIDSTKTALRHVDEIEIADIQRNITRLKTQKIVRIDQRIDFLQDKKLPSIKQTLDMYNKKLNDYTRSVQSLADKQIQDKTQDMIISIQMVNYQNLILNLENQIEDLKLAKEKIIVETIPSLKLEKDNIKNDQIKKLEDQINITLKDKKIDLQKTINNLEYQISKANIKNISLVGNYVIHRYPVKPKKKLIIAVIFIMGIIVSIVFVFFMEFLKGLKEEDRESES